ncbi:hypothetical protein FSP39_006910 [Pinctada imbricata]|uniref:THAP-type domain-containing protein n=1 Tax=Pinctada imbricata TaxID=66713 RepID=A0AA89BVI6_PINIB|nr:hypothetical protein FSP39_006910 [Pinctada imbricata]
MVRGSRRYYCAAEGCFSDTDKRGRYGYMSEVSFFPFPTKKKAPRARKRWLEYTRRENYDPPYHHRLCSKHFLDGKPTEKNPYPTLFAYNNYKESKVPRSSNVMQKRTREQETSVHVDIPEQKHDKIADTTISIQMEGPKAVEVPMDHGYCMSNEKGYEQTSHEVNTQTDLNMTDIDDLLDMKERLADKDNLLRDLFIEKITKSDESVMKYMGVPTKQALNGFFGILDKASPNLKYWSGQKSARDTSYQNTPGMKKSGPQRKLSRYQEFILTLLRLRMALCTFLIADIFGISNSRVSQVCITWINFMCGIVLPLLRWPSSKAVKKFMPRCFKLTYPDTICIIDCTEIFISKPKNPTAQSQTYSNYKHHNTYKALVGITPSGAFSFVSKLWGGNTSDRYITKECGFLDQVRPGDQIMADRGFMIRDLLLERRAKLVIPPFTKACKWGKGKRLTSADIIKTKNIARLRIHVERAIERLKNFRILSNTMPLNLKPVANQVLLICAFMSNFQKPLVKN